MIGWIGGKRKLRRGSGREKREGNVREAKG